MGTITILNGTNVFINSSISAGFNYDWCNKLGPGEYYRLDGTPGGVVTLNTNYWFGESTEYGRDAAVIGTLVGSVALGVVGVVLIPFTGGTSASATLAAVATGASIFTASASLAVTSISIAAVDFKNEPSKWTNIHAAQDRKFIAESTVKIREMDNGDGTIRLSYDDIPPIRLRELQDSEFRKFLNDGAFIEHNSVPLVGPYTTSARLQDLGMLDRKVTIRPSKGGDAFWEIENDQLSDYSPIQLWSRPRTEAKIHWRIQAVNEGGNNDEFFIYNESLKRFATAGTNLGERVTTGDGTGSRRKFHIVITGNAQNEWVFIPVHSDRRFAVVCENGNLGNSTKLVLDTTTTTRPTWALWKLDVI